jgi:NAD+ kinase
MLLARGALKMAIRRVWLKTRTGDPGVIDWARRVYSYLHGRGIKVYVDPFLGHVIPAEQLSETELSNVDLGILIGGDGTFLRVVQKSGGKLPPILGFAVDSLGYLLPHRVTDAEEVLENILSENYSTRNIALGEYALRSEKGVFLNELCIWAFPGKLIEFELSVNGISLYHGRADGVIVATPAGSTGHALSYGGPVILDIGQKILEVLFPGALSPIFRPIIIHDGEVEIKVLTHPANLVLDGHRISTLGYSAELRVSNSDKFLKMLFVEGLEVKINEKLRRRVLDRGFSSIV